MTHNLSRRHFLHIATPVLSGLVFLTQSSLEAEDPHDTTYSITYEEWKDATDKCTAAANSRRDERQALLKTFRNSALFIKVERIYKEPRKAYNGLSREHKAGVNALYNSHHDRTDRISGNKRLTSVGELLVLPVTEGILRPLDIATMLLLAREQSRLKDFYERDIDTDSRSLSLQDCILLYFDRQYTIRNNDDYYRRLREIDSKMSPEEREKEKLRSAGEGADKLFKWLFQ